MKKTTKPKQKKPYLHPLVKQCYGRCWAALKEAELRTAQYKHFKHEALKAASKTADALINLSACMLENTALTDCLIDTCKQAGIPYRKAIKPYRHLLLQRQISAAEYGLVVTETQLQKIKTALSAAGMEDLCSCIEVRKLRKDPSTGLRTCSHE